MRYSSVGEIKSLLSASEIISQKYEALKQCKVQVVMGTYN